MGLENSNSAQFLSIGNGKIIRRVAAPTATSKERTAKNGKLVHEESYDKITGTITGIVVRVHDEYGKFWTITLDDGADQYKLDFKYSSGYASAFLKTLPNVDLSQPVTLIPKMTIEGEKKKTSLFINQHGQALKWYFTKDHRHDLPEMQQVKVKGQLQWDDTDMMEYLENMVKTEILPKLTKAVVAAPVVAGHEDEAIEPDSEMPF